MNRLQPVLLGCTLSLTLLAFASAWLPHSMGSAELQVIGASNAVCDGNTTLNGAPTTCPSPCTGTCPNDAVDYTGSKPKDRAAVDVTPCTDTQDPTNGCTTQAGSAVTTLCGN
jgi:hypothetical protein